MAQKRKISIRKVIQVFFTLVITVCCIVAMVSASKIEDSKLLTGIVVHIKNDKKYHFIEQKEVLERTMPGKKSEVMQTPVGKLDLSKMEENVKADPWVADAQVFIDNSKILHIYVTQRIPIVRIFEQSGHSYFMDTTLHAMPLSGSYKYYTNVVTNVPELNNDSAVRSVRKQIAMLIKTIQADTFWSAQISQVILDSGCNFEMIPVLGNQTIVFGDTSDMKEKFANLFIFYKKVLNRIGWDKYEKLDVRFKDQVVASPSLPFKAPIDKAMDNMNWIKSYEETEARSEARDSARKADSKGKPKTDTKNDNKKPVAKPVSITKPVNKDIKDKK